MVAMVLLPVMLCGGLNPLMAKTVKSTKSGNTATAKKTASKVKSKPSVALQDSYSMAMACLSDMDYSRAVSLMEDYEKMHNAEAVDSVRILNIARVRSIGTMLDNVEKIAIIDSIEVDKAKFFKHYKISSEVGKLVAVKGSNYPAFVTETGDKMLWSAKDSRGHYNIVQSMKLSNGNWDDPVVLDSIFSLGANALYPFMMPDGSKIFYASDGEGSIGGYDIFVSTKSDDGFYKPQNVGMPYNSPYNDYMLVVDEVAHLGWWATERNQHLDKVTIYVFVPNDVRENWQADEQTLNALARVRSIAMTWTDSLNVEDKRRIISEVEQHNKQIEQTSKRDFEEFAVMNGVHYHSYDEFKSERAREQMYRYVALQKGQDTDLASLKKLRIRYGKGDTQLASMIQALEKKTALTRSSLKSLAQDVRRLEISALKKDN